jgi:hypothetical protein
VARKNCVKLPSPDAESETPGVEKPFSRGALPALTPAPFPEPAATGPLSVTGVVPGTPAALPDVAGM